MYQIIDRGEVGGGSGGGGAAPRALDYDSLRSSLRKQLANCDGTVKRRLAAVLFGRPSLKLVQEVLIPNTPYWNVRSGNAIDFYYIGFSSSPQVTFDPDSFVKTVDRFESETKWQYMGGTDVLILDAYCDKGQPALDMSHAMAINLEVAVANRVILDVPVWVESLIHKAKDAITAHGPGSSGDISDGFGKDLIIDALKHLTLALLPEGMRADAEKAFSYVVKDVSK
ncbi:MAG TPA: hypothetical protein VGO59_17145 [Verrucomicrobiae bacterium]|jgi:hypothetical protein